MAMEYKDDQEKSKNVDLENNTEDATERQDRQRRSSFFLVGACIIFVLAFLTYTKTPLHIRNCAHHISLHIHPKGNVELAAIKHHVKKDLVGSKEVCNTPICQKYSQTVLSNLAPNFEQLNPCLDFDAYTCDGFRQHHEIKSFKTGVSTFEIVRDEVEDLLLGLMNGSIPFSSSQTGKEKEAEQANFNTMKKVWDTCMDEEAMKKYGVEPIKQILQEFEKVFPVEGPSLSSGSNEELTNTAIWMYKYGGNGLIDLEVNANFSNPDEYMLGLGGPELYFGKKHYETNKKLLAAYSNAITDMQQVLKSGKPIYQAPMADSDEGEFGAIAKRVIDFEKYLSARTPDANVAHNITYYHHLITVAELEKLVPEFGITKYMKAIVPSQYKISPDLVVNVGDINYYRNFSSIIKETPRRTIHDFFANIILRNHVGNTQSNFSQPLRKVSNLQNGLSPDNVQPQWRVCLGALERSLPHMVSSLYVNQVFTTKDKSLGDSIISQIREVFRKRLGTLEWLSDESRPTALKKVEKMVQKIGYQSSHPDVSSPQDVQDYYKDKVKLLVNENWFEMRRNFFNASLKLSWERFLKPVDHLRWSSPASTVNAFYSSNANSITFPAGIMRSPIFSAELPDYVSYGSFGAVAGHEITHAFDDNGSQFNEKSIMKEWWDQKTKQNFHDRTQCFVDQYSNYTVPGLQPGEQLHVDGKLTLSENIADAGGLNAAYEAWKKNSKNNPSLPGLEHFNNDQMFFVAFGSFWCAKNRKERVVDLVYRDAHSPAGKRIVGTTANSAAFREAFGCPVKKPTCSLW